MCFNATLWFFLHFCFAFSFCSLFFRFFSLHFVANVSNASGLIIRFIVHVHQMLSSIPREHTHTQRRCIVWRCHFDRWKMEHETTHWRICSVIQLGMGHIVDILLVNMHDVVDYGAYCWRMSYEKTNLPHRNHNEQSYATIHRIVLQFVHRSVYFDISYRSRLSHRCRWGSESNWRMRSREWHQSHRRAHTKSNRWRKNQRTSAGK